MKINIKPLHDRVVILPAPAEEKTEGGIYIPETAKEKPLKGTVLAVGEGTYATNNGDFIPTKVKVGDEVVYGKYAGTEITLPEGTFLIMRESDLYAVI